MSPSKRQPPEKEPASPQASVEEMSELEDAFELAVRIRNPLDRAIHYISDVRGVIFDPATRRVRVKLSEQGMDLPPGGIAMEPRFRRIDPHSEAVVTVRLPKTIVKLAEAPSADNDVRFEEHTIAEADQIDLDIGWSDTPYYQDPREKTRGAKPFSSWEKQSLRVTFTPPYRKTDSRRQ
jgi:hypothetical protein